MRSSRVRCLPSPSSIFGCPRVDIILQCNLAEYIILTENNCESGSDCGGHRTRVWRRLARQPHGRVFPPLPHHRLVTLTMALVRPTLQPTPFVLPDLSLSRLDLPEFAHCLQA
jgi:hypothetical protein